MARVRVKDLEVLLNTLEQRVEACERRDARVTEWLWRYGHRLDGVDPSVAYFARAFAIEASPSLVWPLPGEEEEVEPVVLDTTGFDIYPFILGASAGVGVSEVLLLAMVKAESELDPFVVRERIWPDYSYGLIQMTVQTAAGYGIGDGTIASKDSVRDYLFNRQNALAIGAKHLRYCLSVVTQNKPELYGDAQWLMALRVYNGGAGRGMTDEYAATRAATIERYRGALAWAHEVLRR